MASYNTFNQLQLLPLWIISFAAGLFGLMIGSFLNVVIHRLPKMLELQWRQDCAAINENNNGSTNEIFINSYNLAFPASHCPYCNHTLSVYENIPLISFIMQRGRCRWCHIPISWRYPLIEAITGISAAFLICHFGMTTQALAAFCFTAILITASAIDLEHQLLPDLLTLPLLWLGLILSLWRIFIEPSTAIIGAVLGYLSLWIIYWGFKLLTGKEGMGYGDFKLLAALGAWLGWQSLPLVVLLSSFVGSIIGILLIIIYGHNRNHPIPFGPLLAAAGWITLIWRENLFNIYLNWSHLF